MKSVNTLETAPIGTEIELKDNPKVKWMVGERNKNGTIKIANVKNPNNIINLPKNTQIA